jgi:hypothetical protein
MILTRLALALLASQLVLAAGAEESALSLDKP